MTYYLYFFGSIYKTDQIYHSLIMIIKTVRRTEIAEHCHVKWYQCQTASLLTFFLSWPFLMKKLTCDNVNSLKVLSFSKKLISGNKLFSENNVTYVNHQRYLKSIYNTYPKIDFYIPQVNSLIVNF